MTLAGPPTRLLGIAVAAVAAILALSGCGGSSGPSTLHSKPPATGESAKSAGQILHDVGTAVLKAGSVHLAGHVQSTTAIGLDLHLGPKGGRGTVSSNGLAVTVTRIGNAAYFRGSKAFYQHFTTAAGASLLEGRWLKVPASDPRFGAFSDLTDMQTLLATILKPKGAVVKAGTRTLRGISVIALRDSSGAGTLYIAASGPPYPVEIIQTGAHHGIVRFDHWGARVVLKAPRRPVYLTQLAQLANAA